MPEETSTGIEDAFGSETDAPDADALLDPAAVSGAEEAFEKAGGGKTKAWRKVGSGGLE